MGTSVKDLDPISENVHSENLKLKKNNGRDHHHLFFNHHHEDNAETNGGMFSPEIMNNAFSFRDDVFHTQPHDEIRVGSGDEINEAMSNKSYDQGPLETNGQASNGSYSQINGQSFKQQQPHQPQATSNGNTGDTPESPTWLRRLSVKPFNNNASDTNKWNDFKRVLKFNNGKARKESQFNNNNARSDEESYSDEQAKMRASNLITTFLSGAPAAIIGIASFGTDEHGVRRAPLLLPMVGVQLEDITPPHKRHRTYLLHLEYGVGPNRLKWTVTKDVRDFSSLNARLKVYAFQSSQLKGEKKIELPKFPKERKEETNDVSNTLNGRYLSVSQQKSPKKSAIEDNFQPASSNSPRSVHESVTSAGSSTSNHTDNIISHALSRASSLLNREYYNTVNEDELHAVYTKRLELYLKQLMRALTVRAASNRLFHFLELSPIGVLLNYETGYRGKQGYLIVSSTAKAQGWRVSHLKVSDFTQMVKRHTNKWFLIRSSYVTYVSDIYSTTPLDVFLIDPYTTVNYNIGSEDKNAGNENASLYDDGYSLDEDQRKISRKNSLQTHFTIKLENGERSLKLLARSENQARLWVDSLETMIKSTVWSKPNRFNSFAPVRENSYAQWFVDGRDHFWAVSTALELAKDVIYIHDWWLTPELYMRRPANGNQEFRLDRILKRKAEQGVKIFVIVYRNVGATVVTDSLWTKHSLIDLHPNIHVLRSPNQWLQNTYFWAHHEKLCLIDHTVAFIGGIDLCYGRYDTPDHVLVDDSNHDFATRQSATEESVKFQKFPGKDYSNPRVKDFYELEKPYESMYDRDVVPRMPWHDVHMMTAGQPASDLSRHFVQRWNYLLRQKRPSRPTPLLTPPPEFLPEDLKRFNLTGSNEVQILRSSGNWSLGLKKVERSIHDTYLKLIETSQHFVYIENQFFITSTSIDGTVIENRIGDALVDRIIRAHNDQQKWRAVIVIPLMPGFESEVDEAEGSAVRIIMQCQYMSISRGETSIFGKLKKMKINPYDYIQFYSLRKWGRIGPHRRIVSEQLYIHSKILLVDDNVALIGSANINERSQRGNRDSEVAAVVRDTDMVNTTMNGQPYKAGKFCHTLRVRLMREHLGVDVDILEIVEKRFNKLEELAKTTKTGIGSKTNDFSNEEFEIGSSMVELASRDVLNMPEGTNKWKDFKLKRNDKADIEKDDEFSKINESDAKMNLPPHLQENSHEPVDLFYHSFNNRAREENIGIRDKKQYSSDARLVDNEQHKHDVQGKGFDKMDSKEFKTHKVNASKTLRNWAKKSLVNQSNDVFLPNIEQVLEFLNDDDFIKDPQLLTDEEEIVLHERNKERWELLKRVAYLQRVAAKQNSHNEDENVKRSKVGLPNLFVEAFNKQENELNEDSASRSLKPSESDDKSDSLNPKISISENKEIEDLPGDNIPVVSLDPESIEGLLKVFNESTFDGEYNKFVDPYSFSDPLDDSFYEDVWLRNAIRNTLIFREVFHCQPDDTVSSWKQYKDFNKLSTAFGLAQDLEVERRESYDESLNSFENEINNSTIRVPDEKDNQTNGGGILGNAPPSDSGEISNSNSTPGSGQNPALRKNRRGFNALKGSALGEQRVFDRETADRLLSSIQGHIVVFPCDWLSKEVESGNWFYNMDRLPPVEIYN